MIKIQIIMRNIFEKIKKYLKALLKVIVTTLCIFSAIGLVLVIFMYTPIDFKATFKDPWTDIPFVFVRGGCFMMGDQFNLGNEDETPTHKECLSDYFIGEYEITQDIWEKYMQENPSENKQGGQYPVDNISFADTYKFIHILNDISYLNYRLPREAEWEYACRSQGQNVIYDTGDTLFEVNEQKTIPQKTSEKLKTGTIPVHQTAKNSIGLFGMSANVSEWVEDIYYAEYNKYVGENFIPVIPRADLVSIRGGSWKESAKEKRCSARKYNVREFKNNTTGFRLSIFTNAPTTLLILRIIQLIS